MVHHGHLQKLRRNTDFQNPRRFVVPLPADAIPVRQGKGAFDLAENVRADLQDEFDLEAAEAVQVDAADVQAGEDWVVVVVIVVVVAAIVLLWCADVVVNSGIEDVMQLGNVKIAREQLEDDGHIGMLLRSSVLWFRFDVARTDTCRIMITLVKAGIRGRG